MFPTIRQITRTPMAAVLLVALSLLIGFAIGSLISPAAGGNSSHPADAVPPTVSARQLASPPGGLSRKQPAGRVRPADAGVSPVSTTPSTPTTTTEAPVTSPPVSDTATPSTTATDPPTTPTDPPSVITGPNGEPRLASPRPLLPSIPQQPVVPPVAPSP